MSDQSEFDKFVYQDYGFMGLYGGLKLEEIHARKGLKPGQNILDYMGFTELAVNCFRITQTEEKLNKEGIIEIKEVCQAYLEVGKIIRQTIHELGGAMPEDLPTELNSDELH